MTSAGRLVIIMIIFIFKNTDLYYSQLLHSNHTLRFFNYEFYLLPANFLLKIFPAYSLQYLMYISPFIICRMYNSFFLLILKVISFSLCIHLFNFTFHTFKISILWYIHDSKVSFNPYQCLSRNIVQIT